MSFLVEGVLAHQDSQAELWCKLQSPCNWNRTR